MSDEPTLLLFPGLGGDSRIYEPQRRLPIRLQFAEWPEPESQRETLAHYAQRIAARIPPRSGLYVGGISLGAVVALEAARLLNAKAVLMIGGCTSHGQISPLFRGILRAGAMLPLDMIHPLLLLAPPALKLFERMSKQHVALMTQMLQGHSPAQTRWSCRALLEWECCAIEPGVPVHSIHGENDEVIPLKNVKVDQVIPSGRHMINLSHANEVNAFLTHRITTDSAKTHVLHGESK